METDVAPTSATLKTVILQMQASWWSRSKEESK